MSEVIQLAQEFKNSLANQHNIAVMEMADQWYRSKGAIDMKVWDLRNEIRQAKEAGTYAGLEQQWVRELAYYEQLREQVTLESNKYSAWAKGRTNEYAEQSYFIGNVEATRLIGASYNGVFPDFYNRLAKNELEVLYSQLRYDTPLENLFVPLKDATWHNVQDSLFNGLMMGKPLDKIAEDMSQASDLSYKRATVIARTEISRARRESTRETYQASGVVMGYKRFANKTSACLACLLLDGEYYQVEAEFEDHPNGACTLIPWVKGQPEPTWQTGSEYFEKMTPEQQEAMMGKEYFAAWKDGKFSLSDMVWHAPNHEWGASPAIRALWNLEGYSSYQHKLSELALNRQILSGMSPAQAAKFGRMLSRDELEQNIYSQAKNASHHYFLRDQQGIPVDVYSDRSRVKDELVGELSRMTGMDYDTVNDLIHQWAATSNDESILSLRLQEAAARLSGGNLSDWQKGKLDMVSEQIRRGTIYGGKDVTLSRKLTDGDLDNFIGAMYRNTQSQLTEDYYVVYRGYKIPTTPNVWDALNRSYVRDEGINLEFNAINSFSTEQSTARNFASSVGETSVVVEVVVPKESILSTAFSGFGCLNEYEFVVFGSPGDQGVISWLSN